MDLKTILDYSRVIITITVQDCVWHIEAWKLLVLSTDDSCWTTSTLADLSCAVVVSWLIKCLYLCLVYSDLLIICFRKPLRGIKQYSFRTEWMSAQKWILNMQLVTNYIQQTLLSRNNSLKSNIVVMNTQTIFIFLIGDVIITLLSTLRILSNAFRQTLKTHVFYHWVCVRPGSLLPWSSRSTLYQ